MLGAVFLGLVVVLCVLSLVVLVRKVARPLTGLSDAAEKIAAGDLAVELPGEGVGEVGQLVEAFNHMA